MDELLLQKEERIVSQILEHFPVLIGHVNIQRSRRIIFDSLPRERFEEVFLFLVKELDFKTFHLVIGVDDGDDLGFVYAISNNDNIIALVKERASKTAPCIRSVCSIFPNALWHERELVDLFGAIVEELPPGPSYPLPDNWPAGNYPLRKDWNPAYFDRDSLTYNPPVKAVEE